MGSKRERPDSPSEFVPIRVHSWSKPFLELPAMNDDTNSLHPWIAPELEARLTALVLGEASDFERDELERLVAERPELGLYRERLEAMHRMLREVATGESGEAVAGWRLAADRRERLLAQLSEKIPSGDKAVVISGSKRRLPWGVVIRIAACIAVIALLLGLMFPATTGVLRKTQRPGDREIGFASSGSGSDSSLAFGDLANGLSAPTSAPPAPPAEQMAVTRSGQIGALNGEAAIGSGGVALRIDPNSPTTLSVTTSGSSSAGVSVGGGFDGRDGRGRALVEKPVTSTLSGENTYTGGTAITGGGVFAINSPESVTTAPASDPTVADPETRLTKLGAGTLSLNGGTVDLSLSKDVVEFDGFIDHKKTDAPASAPNDRGNLNFTGDMQVNGGVEAKVNAEKNFLSIASGGVIAYPSKKEQSEGLGFEAPAKLDALSRAAGGGGEAGQEGDVSRLGRSVAVDKSLSQATESEVKRERTGDWGKAPVGKAPIEESVDLGGEISAGYASDYIFIGNRMNVIEGNRDKADVPALATPSKDLNTIVYHVPPSFLSTAPPGANVADPFADPVSAGGAAPAGRVTAKQILESAGISFPEGATAIYNAETSQLIVRNTADQAELVEAFVNSVGGVDTLQGFGNQTGSFSGTVNFGARISQIQEGVADVDKSVQDILALTSQANLINGEELDTLHASTDVGGRFRTATPVAGLSELDTRRKAMLTEVAANWESPTPAALAETSPAAEPFSTFSLHVSDVSFQLAKSSLASGKWPEAEKIRIEEFVNAFDYGDPIPAMKDRVACRIDQGAHPFLQQRNLVRIALRTAEAGRSSGTPLRLTLLLDSSGSMERPDRRATLTRAVATLAGLLGENDRITLVSFARQPRLVADAVAGNEAMKLAGIVAALPSEGGTNLEAALQLAFEKAREHQEPNAQNRIVLLTDGAANLGDAKAESLASLVAGMRESGIAFDAAGFGAEGLNDEILEALTRKGDGRYYLLDRPEDADDAFAKQIAGALRPAAKNVKVQVEFNPDRVKSYKLLGFEKHRLATEDFRNDAVDAAEMAAAEAGVAVYQVEPMAAGEGDLGSVSVRFRDLDSGEMIERRWALPHLDAAPAAEQGGEAILLATVASQFAAKLGGGPLGDLVDLGELARLAAALPESERVKELRTMIEQARNLEGGSVSF
jgi:Mg-chelatase subunit ChlD